MRVVPFEVRHGTYGLLVSVAAASGHMTAYDVQGYGYDAEVYNAEIDRRA